MRSCFKTAGVLTAAMAILGMSACTDEQQLLPDKNEEFTRAFVKEFGAFDTKHDWNLAMQCNAEITGEIPTEAETVRVYSARPGTPGAKLMAEYPASTTSFKFDIAKDMRSVFLEYRNADGRAIYGNTFAVNGGTMRAEAEESGESCPVTIGNGILPNNVVSADIRNFPDDVKETWKKLLGEERYERAMLPGDEAEIVKAVEVFKTYILDGKQTEPGTPQPFSYMAGIVGREGRFLEQVCNVSKFREDLHPELGVEYTLAEDGPVTLTYFWGGTAHFNKLGYFYYKDGATLEEIMKAPRFIIIDDAQPHRNITRGSSATEPGQTQFNGGMDPPTMLDFWELGQTWMEPATYVTGTKHRLVYFGEGNEFEKGTTGSYTFPAGTHVGFFVVKNIGEDSESKEVPWKRSYSLPALNKLMNYTTTHDNTCGLTESKTYSNEDFVTYRWHGYTMMGIEDGVDHDVNDMMFFVNANIAPTDIVEMGDPDPTPEAQSWILAIEDLGSTDDFDFNDLVVKVSHVAGSGKATIEPLAAGGTLQMQLMFGDNTECVGAERGFIHINEFFGEPDHTVMLNTRTITHKGEAIEIDVPADFSMSADAFTVTGNRMGGFHVRVKQGGSFGDWTQGVVDIKPAEAGSVPQILCVPGDWQWPVERVNIGEAYPEILDWIKDRTVNTDWYAHPKQGKVVDRRK